MSNGNKQPTILRPDQRLDEPFKLWDKGHKPIDDEATKKAKRRAKRRRVRMRKHGLRLPQDFCN